MNKLIVRAVCALAASVACSGAFAEGANLIDNGTLAAPFTSGWAPSASAFTYSTGVTGSDGSFLAIPAVTEVDQGFGLGEILAGNTYTVSFSALGFGSVAVELSSPGPSNRVALTSLPSIADANLGTPDYFDVSGNDAWRTYSFSFESGANTAGRLLLKGAAGGFNVDTLSVTMNGAVVSAVPEPESYAMMLAGLGAMGFMARRRKNRA